MFQLFHFSGKPSRDFLLEIFTDTQNMSKSDIIQTEVPTLNLQPPTLHGGQTHNCSLRMLSHLDQSALFQISLHTSHRPFCVLSALQWSNQNAYPHRAFLTMPPHAWWLCFASWGSVMTTTTIIKSGVGNIWSDKHTSQMMDTTLKNSEVYHIVSEQIKETRYERCGKVLGKDSNT